MKIRKIKHGHGESIQIVQYKHTVQVYNELEAEVSDGENLSDVQKKLFIAVDKLNQRDFEAFKKEE